MYKKKQYTTPYVMTICFSVAKVVRRGGMAVAVILALQTASARAQSAQDIELMKQIARNCREVQSFGFPIEKIQLDNIRFKVLQDERYLERDTDELSHSIGGIEKISYIVNEKPFSEILSTCRDSINKNKLMIESLPTPDEVQVIERISTVCDTISAMDSSTLSEQRHVEEFNRSKARYEGAVLQIPQRLGNPENIPLMVQGVVFSETIKACRKKIADSIAILNGGQETKVAETPPNSPQSSAAQANSTSVQVAETPQSSATQANSTSVQVAETPQNSAAQVNSTSVQSAQDIELMRQIARNCRDVKILELPIDNIRVSQVRHDLEASERFLKRDSDELSSRLRNIENISQVIDEKPFSEILSTCRDNINKNKLALESLPTPEEFQVLSRISVVCSEMPTLEPSTASAMSKIKDFRYSKELYERVIGQMPPRLGNPEEISLTVGGAPFSEHVAVCRKKIDDNIALLISAQDRQLAELGSTPSQNQTVTENVPARAQNKSSAKNIRPSPSTPVSARAADAADIAVSLCYRVLELLSKSPYSDELFEFANNSYSEYMSMRDVAIAADPDILARPEYLLGGCDPALEQPYQDFLTKRRERTAITEARARAEAAREAEEAKKEEERRARYAEQQALYEAEMKEFANKNGLDDIFFGLEYFYQRVVNGSLDLKEAKSLLIIPTSGDGDFKFTTFVDKYAIYGYVNSDFQFKQVAVIREKKRLYIKDSSLPDGYYALVKAEEFTTVLGAREQVLVFKRVE
jgi:hypothetical protein